MGVKAARFGGEFRELLRLAAPLMLAELGWMMMGTVDTMMVGRLSATAIGAVSLGGVLFYTVAICGAGLLLGLDPLVSQAFGAGKLGDCHHALLSGLYVILPLTPVLMTAIWLGALALPGLGMNPSVLREALPYLRTMMWSIFPLLLYFASRRYLQAMNLAKVVMFAVLSANVINFGANWVLIFGHWGAPPMGVVGAGWSTFLARVYMAAVLVGYILYHDRRRQTGLLRISLQPDFPLIRRLLKLGLPAAVQIGLEGGVFATATALIARLDATALAAHQIALNTATFTYMMPLGISSAAAVRVGQALGRGDGKGAGRSGWIAIGFGGALMSCAAAAFLLAPRLIARIYTTEASVIASAASLLIVAAFFELFDGIQTVATGALRGAGDTHTAALSHLVAYWLVGLPVGYYLCFTRGWGAAGLWTGLCVALVLIGIVLFWAWHRRVRLDMRFRRTTTGLYSPCEPDNSAEPRRLQTSPDIDKIANRHSTAASDASESKRAQAATESLGETSRRGSEAMRRDP